MPHPRVLACLEHPSGIGPMTLGPWEAPGRQGPEGVAFFPGSLGQGGHFVSKYHYSEGANERNRRRARYMSNFFVGLKVKVGPCGSSWLRLGPSVDCFGPCGILSELHTFLSGSGSHRTRCAKAAKYCSKWIPQFPEHRTSY